MGVRFRGIATFLQSIQFLVLVAFMQSLHSEAQSTSGDAHQVARDQLVREVLVPGGVKDPRVLKSIGTTPRHEFVPQNQQDKAYFDLALPIGDKQTISSPYIVSVMTEALEPQPTDKVLEIGTGSGYQAAILSPLVKEVYTIEIVRSLGERATKVLDRLGTRMFIPHRRWLFGLARSSSFRQDHRHLLSRESSSTIDRSIGRGRPDDRSCR